MPSTSSDDRVSYETWVRVQQAVESPLDRVGAFWKYVMSAYLPFRSRLVAPGRAYDSDDVGMLAMGGSAHCDVMDLEVKLAAMSDEAKGDAYDWTLGSSQEQVAYWRGLVGPKRSQQAVSKRRNNLADRIANELGD